MTTSTTRNYRHHAVPAGVVAVRLSGAHADVAALATMLVSLDWDGQLDLTEVTEPRANRWEPGERVYLTVGLPRKGDQR